jgi:hypothetical protein
MDNSQFSLFSLHPSWKEKQIKLVPNYEIEKYIKPISKKMNIKKNNHIYLCVYNIQASDEFLHTHLKYFLYKQPNSNNNFSNLITFPYITYTSGNPIKIAEKTINNIFNINLDCKGFVEKNNDLYFFYNYDTPIKYTPLLKENTKYWWGLIDEICNKKEILNYPIHETVSNLFLDNPGIIYLTVFYNDINHKLEIPVVGYKGGYYKLINKNFELIDRNLYSMFGPYYNFSSSFTKSLRLSCWTNNYKPAYFNKIQITNENGKYLKSKVVRTAIFLGNSQTLRGETNSIFKKIINIYDTNDIKTNYNKQIKYKFEWDNDTDTILLGEIPFKKLQGHFHYINTDIIVKTKDRFIPLTIHDINVESMGEFHNNKYKNYKIQ